MWFECRVATTCTDMMPLYRCHLNLAPGTLEVHKHSGFVSLDIPVGRISILPHGHAPWACIRFYISKKEDHQIICTTVGQ